MIKKNPAAFSFREIPKAESSGKVLHFRLKHRNVDACFDHANQFR